MKFNILISEIRAALLFASCDESRYVLNSVFVEVKAGNPPILIATDGRRMVVIESQAEQSGELSPATVVLNADFLKPLCAFATKKTSVIGVEPHPPKRVIFHLSDDALVVDAEKGAVVEGEYPNWRQVVPCGERTPISEIAFNGEFLSDFTKAAKLIKATDLGLMMNIYSAGGATEIRLSGKPNFYGVVMPMNLFSSPEWQPSFLGLESKPAVAA
jgi:hypothetical protein